MATCPACGLPIRLHDHERALQCLLILAMLARRGTVTDATGQTYLSVD